MPQPNRSHWVSLYIGNLPEFIKETDLEDLFSKHADQGSLKSVVIEKPNPYCPTTMGTL